jgi:hypothetical protein
MARDRKQLRGQTNWSVPVGLVEYEITSPSFELDARTFLPSSDSR